MIRSLCSHSIEWIEASLGTINCDIMGLNPGDWNNTRLLAFGLNATRRRLTAENATTAENRNTDSFCYLVAFRKRCCLETEKKEVGQDTTEIIEFETAFTASYPRERNLPSFHVAIRCSFRQNKLRVQCCVLCASPAPHHTSFEQGMPRQSRICLERYGNAFNYDHTTSSLSSDLSVAFPHPPNRDSSTAYLGYVTFSRLTLRTPCIGMWQHHASPVTFFSKVESSYLILQEQRELEPYIRQRVPQNSRQALTLHELYIYTSALITSDTYAWLILMTGDQEIRRKKRKGRNNVETRHIRQTGPGSQW